MGDGTGGRRFNVIGEEVRVHSMRDMVQMAIFHGTGDMFVSVDRITIVVEG